MSRTLSSSNRSPTNSKRQTYPAQAAPTEPNPPALHPPKVSSTPDPDSQCGPTGQVRPPSEPNGTTGAPQARKRCTRSPHEFVTAPQEAIRSALPANRQPTSLARTLRRRCFRAACPGVSRGNRLFAQPKCTQNRMKDLPARFPTRSLADGSTWQRIYSAVIPVALSMHPAEHPQSGLMRLNHSSGGFVPRDGQRAITPPSEPTLCNFGVVGSQRPVFLRNIALFVNRY